MKNLKQKIQNMFTADFKKALLFELAAVIIFPLLYFFVLYFTADPMQAAVSAFAAAAFVASSSAFATAAFVVASSSAFAAAAFAAAAFAASSSAFAASAFAAALGSAFAAFGAVLNSKGQIKFWLFMGTLILEASGIYFLIQRINSILM